MLTASDDETAHDVAATPGVFDPYLRHAEMPFAVMYYPLGFPLHLHTNSEEVLEAAEECWGSFSRQFDTPVLQLRIGVLEGGPAECPPTPVCRAQRSLMVRVAGQDNFHVADLVQNYSFVWLTTAAVSHKSYLRYHFLEATALTHIASRYTTPIHAACVELHGRGVLLCGESGAGKSTLSFACARAGWTYITDDASFLLHGRTDRQVVGACQMIRLRPSGADLFEEAAGKVPSQRAAGKPSIELRTADLPGITTAGAAVVDHIVFLNRADGNSQELLRLPRESVRPYMHRHLCGIEELRGDQIASVERLLAAEVFELRYQDLNWAVDRLERLVREQG